MGNEYSLIRHELNIVKQLADVDEHRIIINEIGWTSRTYIVDNGRIVFKFPRNDEGRKNAVQEINSLKLIKGQRFNLNVPILNWSNENNEYIGFYGIEGESIKEIVHILTVKEKEKIGTSIGVFLKQLHSITSYDKPNIMTIKDWIKEIQEKYVEIRNELIKHFSKKDMEVIDNLIIDVSNKMCEFDEDLAFCHGDLCYSNILIDSKNNVGIIDFGDTGLYDRHQDFSRIEDIVIRNATYNAYGASEKLIEKANCYATIVPILDVHFYMGKSDPKGIQECVNKIKCNIL